MIIGDVVRSRRLPDRGAFQSHFLSALTAVNTEFSSRIASRLTITLGDEFQGVLCTPVPFFRVVARVQDLLRPVRFRFGVGLGEILTPLRPEAVGMDGPAFHRARRALEEARKLGGTRVRFCSGEPWDAMVNALLGLAWLQRERWTEEQRQVVELLATGMSQRAVAGRLGTSESNVSQLLKRAHLEEVREAVRALESFFARSGGEEGEDAAAGHTL